DHAGDDHGRRRPEGSDCPRRGPVVLRARGIHAEAALVRAVPGQAARRRALDEARDPRRHGRDTDGPRHDRGRSPRAGPPPGPSGSPKTMKRWEAWWNHAALVAISVTGLVYGAFMYFVPSPDPDSRAGHPWQPGLLKAHLIVA